MKKYTIVQAACLLACAASPFAAQSQSGSPANAADTPEIIVTASRSEQVLQTAPVGATVITRAQIESSGVVDANEAIRKIGGVAARGDQNGGRDYKLDLRGFGETADQNTVVLVDGIRISENEMAAARLSSISAHTIDRIEVIRGGSSVMWGEGATSGVINIILRKDVAKGAHGSTSATVESFGGVDGNVNLRVGTGKGVFDINARSMASNGFRDNSRFMQDSAAVGFSANEGAVSIRTRFDTDHAMNRWPGGLSYLKNKTNPVQTDTPNNWGSLKLNKFSAGMDYRLGAWTAIVDLGIRSRSSTSFFSGSPTALRTSESTQVSPKAVYLGNVGATVLSATLGSDIQSWTFHGDNVPDSTYTAVKRDGKQSSRALFAMTDWLLPSQTRIVVGYRTEAVSKNATDVGGANTVNVLNNKLKASEFSINQTLSTGLDIYSRLSRSYRLGSIDDYMATQSGVALRPQISNDKEIGVKWRQSANSLTARYFIQNTIDEIYLNPTTFKNINFDPTKRSGLEVSGATQLSNSVSIAGTVQSMRAIFTSGVYAGNHIPLVNERVATLRATYKIDAKNSVETAWRMLSASYAGSDEANTCVSKIPSSRQLDALYRWREKGLEVSFGANNLTNQKSYHYDYNCGGATAGYVYPEAGRTVRATVKYNF